MLDFAAMVSALLVACDAPPHLLSTQPGLSNHKKNQNKLHSFEKFEAKFPPKNIKNEPNMI